MKKQTLKETLNSPLTRAGIFGYLPTYFNNTALQQSTAYYMLNKNRTITDVFDDYLDTNGKVTAAGEEVLAGVISTMFKANWDKLYAAYIEEYDPLKNITGTRTVEDTFTGGHSSTNNYGKTETEGYDNWNESISSTNNETSTNTVDTTETQTTNLTEAKTLGTNQTTTLNTTESDTLDSDVVNLIAGADQSGFANSDKTITDNTDTKHNTGTIQVADSGTVSNGTNGTVTNDNDGTVSNTTNGTNTTNRSKTGTITTTEGGTDSEQFVYNNEKHTSVHSIDMNGGISVTPQIMLEQELEFRKKHFYNVMFRDINSVLTLKVYA